METSERQKNEKFIEGMLNSDSTFDEIKASLLKKNLREIEISALMAPFYKIHLKKKIKRQVLISIILISAIISFVGLYLYGEYQNQEIVEASNSPLVFVSRYDFFMKLAVWCFFGLIVSIIRHIILKRSLNKIK